TLAPAALVCRLSASRFRSRFRTALVAVQIAFTVTLLVGAGLFVLSFNEALQLDFGMNPENVVVASIEFDGAGYRVESIRGVMEDVLGRVGRLPDVAAASVSLSTPFAGRFFAGGGVSDVQPYAVGAPEGAQGPFLNAVSPQFFEVLGM